jgi:hypothetical protein
MTKQCNGCETDISYHENFSLVMAYDYKKDRFTGLPFCENCWEIIDRHCKIGDATHDIEDEDDHENN